LTAVTLQRTHDVVLHSHIEDDDAVTRCFEVRRRISTRRWSVEGLLSADGWHEIDAAVACRVTQAFDRELRVVLGQRAHHHAGDTQTPRQRARIDLTQAGYTSSREVLVQ